MPGQDEDAAKPRTRENDNLKPGEPPRSATEPDGSEPSVQNNKTLTDPSTGEPNPNR